MLATTTKMLAGASLLIALLLDAACGGTATHVPPTQEPAKTATLAPGSSGTATYVPPTQQAAKTATSAPNSTGGTTLSGGVTMELATARLLTDRSCDQVSVLVGYSDIQGGGQVVVKDDSGRVIGTGQLQAGQRVDSICWFLFAVTNLPDRNFYTVFLGSREGGTYGRQELVAAGWKVKIRISD